MTGIYNHTLDAKGRLFIPARLRDSLGKAFYVSLSGDMCLNGYPERQWDAFCEKVEALTRDQRDRFRPVFAHAARCELDAQGRILLPKELRDLVNIEKDVTIVGNNDRAEFWSSDEWSKQDMKDTSPESLKALFSLGYI